jgi:hypothetical protein
MEQLKVCTNDLPSVTMKKVVVAAALGSSTKAFPKGEACPPAGGAHGGGDQYPVGGGGGQYPAGGSGGGHVGGCSAIEDPPTASRILDPYENPVI